MRSNWYTRRIVNVQLKVLPNQDVELWQGDQKVKTFETTQDPGLGLKLLLKVDSLKDKEGRAIYENYKSGSHFLWGLHQEEMLHAYCRAFVAYRSVLVYLEENQLRVVSCSDTTASGLSTLISLWLPHLKSNSLKKIFGRYLRDLVWLLICLSAVISGRLRRVKVGLFSYDQIWQGHTFDRRLKDIYALLERKKIGFLEIFPGFAVLSLKHFLKRKRLALYYPAVLNEKCLHIEYDFSGWSALEAKFVKKLVRLFEEKIDRDQKIVQSLKRFLKSSGLRKIYSIDDAWDTTPLVVAAAECEIELIGIQHGYLDRYHQGWLQEGLPQEFALGFPELWVWGESTKKSLE